VWVDTHCHLQPDHAGDGDPDAAIAAAHAAGVDWMVCIGTDLATSRTAIDLAGRHAGVRASVGLHPHDALRLEQEWPSLRALASDPAVVAIGEAGFDLYYEHSPREAQDGAFRAQIRLAHELDLPLVIHTRDAWPETFAVLDDEGVPRRCVLHCFSGGPAEAAAALERGCYLSFSGIVSFKNATPVRAAAGICPPERLLVETDSPYLAPVPHRGRRNEPAFVGAVGAALADARGADPADIAALTSANAAAVFG
jgi:TatD DNase family protein